MPEGHTIHRAALDQRPHFAGKRVKVTAPDGRNAADAEHLDGRTLKAIEPVGKHLFYHFGGKSGGGPASVHVHLALFGKLRLHAKAEPPEPKGAVRMRFTTRQAALDLHGCRTVELLDDEAIAELKDRLGPDPLDPKADAERVWTRISKSKAPIAGLLMDQAVVSGLGNIFRAEILFRQRIDPHRLGKELTREQFDRLWADAVLLLNVGVKQDRIITVTKQFAKERYGKTFSKLARRERWYAYKQPACPFTGGPIETYELGGRTVYWSPRWQTNAEDGFISGS